MPDKKTKKNIVTGRFYSDILGNTYIDKMHIDEKVHWILGVSTVMLGFSLPSLRYEFTLDNLGFLIIFVAALISFLIALLTLEIPEFIRKVPHSDKSLMYYKGIKSMSPEIYAEKLRNVEKIEEISDHYAYNVVNIVNRNNNIKSELIKFSIYFLWWGIILGVLLIVIFGTGNIQLGAVAGA